MEIALKIPSLLRSPRFWGLVIIGVLQALLQTGVISGADLEVWTQVIQMITGGAVGIRTIDRIAEKVGK